MCGGLHCSIVMYDGTASADECPLACLPSGLRAVHPPTLLHRPWQGCGGWAPLQAVCPAAAGAGCPHSRGCHLPSFNLLIKLTRNASNSLASTWPALKEDPTTSPPHQDEAQGPTS
eukprot:832887-Pelagomonas_calceolata.AAC.6